MHRSTRLTVIGTSDLHARVLDWDYTRDAPYQDEHGNHVGLARAATLIREVRRARGAATTITLDAGDTIQGTPLGELYSQQRSVLQGHLHPMSAAMNAVGYDAAAPGNHEFNFGVDHLQAWSHQLDFPLLAANVYSVKTGDRAFTPYVLKDIPATEGTVRVGIAGFVTPGCAVWDKRHVEGKLRFNGIIEEARMLIPQMKAAGADVIIVASHSGPDGESTYPGSILAFPENVSIRLAEQVPGINAILVGHAHREIAALVVRNRETGREVLLTEPGQWGQRVSVMTLDIEDDGAGFSVTGASGILLNTSDAKEDPGVVRSIGDAHEFARQQLARTS